MMRSPSLRYALRFVPLLGIMWGALLVVPAHASGSVSFDHRDYQMTIQRNGDVAVVEHWQIHFTGGPFHHAFLQLSLVKTTGIAFGTVRGDGVTNQAVTQTTNAQGEPAEQVAWDFPATQDAPQTFDIPYTIHGALQVNATQAWFDWHYFDGPSGTPIPILASVITVTLPTATPAANVTTQAVSPDGKVATSALNTTTVQAQAGGTVADHALEMQVAFPRSEVAATVTRQPWQTDATPPTLAAQPVTSPGNTDDGNNGSGYSPVTSAPSFGGIIQNIMQNIMGALACLLLPLLFLLNLVMRAGNYNGGARTNRWIGGNRFFGPYGGGPFNNGGPFMGGGAPPPAPPPSPPPSSGGGGGASGFS